MDVAPKPRMGPAELMDLYRPMIQTALREAEDRAWEETREAFVPFNDAAIEVSRLARAFIATLPKGDTAAMAFDLQVNVDQVVSQLKLFTASPPGQAPGKNDEPSFAAQVRVIRDRLAELTSNDAQREILANLLVKAHLMEVTRVPAEAALTNYGERRQAAFLAAAEVDQWVEVCQTHCLEYAEIAVATNLNWTSEWDAAVLRSTTALDRSLKILSSDVLAPSKKLIQERSASKDALITAFTEVRSRLEGSLKRSESSHEFCGNANPRFGQSEPPSEFFDRVREVLKAHGRPEGNPRLSNLCHAIYPYRGKASAPGTQTAVRQIVAALKVPNAKLEEGRLVMTGNRSEVVRQLLEFVL